MSSQNALVKAPLAKLPVPKKEIALRKDERRLLDEALRRGEDMRETTESAVMAYGRWLLAEVFKNDTAAATNRKSDNRVWRELLRRAGGPTLAISTRMLYVAVALAAYDKSLPDRSWRGLDAGRKEELLPLGEPDAIRSAAKHVSSLNLTRASTEEYVTQLRRESGAERPVRLTLPRVMGKMRGLGDFLTTPAVHKRLLAMTETLDASDRKKMTEEAQRIRHSLDALMRALKKRA